MSATSAKLIHRPVLLEDVISFVPQKKDGFLLDVTAGGGGHFFEILSRRASWRGECWDRDPLAGERIAQAARKFGVEEKFGKTLTFARRRFGDSPAPAGEARWDFVLADIGVSSFQLDDPARGMSFKSESPPDFRMDPSTGLSFGEWLRQTSETELARVFDIYGEEPRAKKLATEMKLWSDEAFASAHALAEKIRSVLAYGTPSRVHPATRAFQAMRIAVNDELGELERFLAWAPGSLNAGGRLAVISFHSLEDRIVKNRFRDLAASDDFVILTKKPLVPSETESEDNPRARSAKLRVIEKRAGEHATTMEKKGPKPKRNAFGPH